MTPVERYFADLRDIHATGEAVPEISYYGSFERLLNGIGGTLKPKVRCVINIADRGAGNPDGGLFTATQFRNPLELQPLPGQLPERGVIEVKPTSDDAWVTADGEQVSRYWGRYGLILVTNYRDFVLIGKDAGGHSVKLETYRLAEDEASFWTMVAHPRTALGLHGARLTEYLTRVMLHAAPLSTPEDVAWFLASYARDAKARIENVELPALASLRQALEDALGLKFVGEKGEHFFRSTLIQTLFYGVFSAWVLWSKERPLDDRTARFDWRTAAWSLRVPMIRALFHQLVAPSALEPLHLVEPLDWSSSVLNRVNRVEFFQIFDRGQAVLYFYEPFLQQFDPELRKELGVWFTPPEIVKYMVTRVDTVLREELGIPDGFADPRVYVLDPCCGTGTYLVEVLKQISLTIKEKGGDALAAQDVKKAAMERVFGFEILPAPFVVSHLQLGLLLQQLEAPLSHTGQERVGVYLTNSLTGWAPLNGPKQQLLFPELEQEREAAEEIKRDKPILVILGNPPYNAFAGVSPAEEEGLVDQYKIRLNVPVEGGGWGIRKFNLDDLYVRFLRLAERRVVEGKPGKGVVSFITNFSYLRNPSFVVMRQRFAGEFDALWFDCMNGDSRETGKRTPVGKPDPSVFSTEYHPVGIRVGTAISLMVRKGEPVVTPIVRFRDLWGVSKRTDLLKSLAAKDFNEQYQIINPGKENRYAFRPLRTSATYAAWPKVVDLCSERPINGLMEKRAGALIDIDRASLEARMKAYYDSHVEWDSIKALGSGLTADAAGFNAKAVRQKVLAAETFQPDRIVRYAARPFDNRWCYYSDVSPLWNRARPSLWAQYLKGNQFLLTRPHSVARPEGVPLFFTRLLGDNDFLRGHAYNLPFVLYNPSKEARRKTNQKSAGRVPRGTVPNLSDQARRYLESLGASSADKGESQSALIWMHVLAVGYSPSYLRENSDGVLQDWLRIPMPGSRNTLEESAMLGRFVADLLDSESHVEGVTSGRIRPEIRMIAPVSKAGGRAINPEAGELRLTAGWGHAGKEDAVMPGKGRVEERERTPAELAALGEGAAAQGLTPDQALQLLGASTCDIFLNDAVYWQNIPTNVWEYTIGGFQVIKKWLSYRHFDILGRALSMEEVREVTDIARRVAALVLLEPALDANYRSVKNSVVEWSAFMASDGPLGPWMRADGEPEERQGNEA